MPIYMVRWPGLSVSLIRARNEEELADIIDEVSDPGGCKWNVYKGPLWLDLSVPVKFIPQYRDDSRPLTMDEFDLHEVERLAAEGWRLDVCLEEDAETTWAMIDALTEWAFPNVSSLLQKLRQTDDTEQIPAVELKAALKEDLAPLLEYEWRRSQLERRTDHEAAMMKMLGVTVPLPAMKKARKEEPEE